MAKISIFLPVVFLLSCLIVSLSPTRATDTPESKMIPESGPAQQSSSSKLPLNSTESSTGQAKTDSIPTQLKEGTEAKATLKMTEITSLVHPGDKVTVRVKTEPKALCKIDVKATDYTGKTTLKEKTADSKGFVKWSWRLDKAFKGDTLPVQVTSVINNREEKIEATIPVKSIATSPKGKTL